jgi:hypothetical protein
MSAYLNIIVLFLLKCCFIVNFKLIKSFEVVKNYMYLKCIVII